MRVSAGWPVRGIWVQRMVDAGVLQIVTVTDPMQLGFAARP
jgi:hypothetical protein